MNFDKSIFNVHFEILLTFTETCKYIDFENIKTDI